MNAAIGQHEHPIGKMIYRLHHQPACKFEVAVSAARWSDDAGDPFAGARYRLSDGP
jgi:hypothetical protein